MDVDIIQIDEDNRNVLSELFVNENKIDNYDLTRYCNCLIRIGSNEILFKVYVRCWKKKENVLRLNDHTYCTVSPSITGTIEKKLRIVKERRDDIDLIILIELISSNVEFLKEVDGNKVEFEEAIRCRLNHRVLTTSMCCRLFDDNGYCKMKLIVDGNDAGKDAFYLVGNRTKIILKQLIYDGLVHEHYGISSKKHVNIKTNEEIEDFIRKKIFLKFQNNYSIIFLELKNDKKKFFIELSKFQMEIMILKKDYLSNVQKIIDLFSILLKLNKGNNKLICFLFNLNDFFECCQNLRKSSTDDDIRFIIKSIFDRLLSLIRENHRLRLIVYKEELIENEKFEKCLPKCKWISVPENHEISVDNDENYLRFFSGNEKEYISQFSSISLTMKRLMQRKQDNRSLIAPKLPSYLERKREDFQINEKCFNKDLLRILHQFTAPHRNKELFEKFNMELPNGFLINGRSGTGKTSFVNYLIQQLKSTYTFFNVTAADLYSSFVGQSERKLRKMFQDARLHSPSVIFIDEIDGIFGKRTNENQSTTAVQQRLITTLLTELDGIGVSLMEMQMINNQQIYHLSSKQINQSIIFIAATNRLSAIDRALLRPGRIDRIINVEMPTEIERKHFFEHQLSINKISLTSTQLQHLIDQTNNWSFADLKWLLTETVLFTIKNRIDKNVDLESDWIPSDNLFLFLRQRT
ncbi:hypothetical protein SNEBB_003813 [Seison nebaliae]|nr:hypothetical protein SNEBB_003813 [Seison nebaliae]